MKPTLTLTVLSIALCLPACRATERSSSAPSASTATQTSSPSPRSSGGDFIDRCLEGASQPGMRLKVMGDFAVYSRKGDFDGNKIEDVAVLVNSDSRPNKGGMLVCRNGEPGQSSAFGALFKPASPLSSFEDDNFITAEWDVILKSESPKIALDANGRSRIENRNKGDVIAFFHEGGAVFIFWDGSAFRLVEGG